jgi:hypothetical protein
MSANFRSVPMRSLDLRTVLEHTWLKRRLLAQLRENHENWASSTDTPMPAVLQGMVPRLAEARTFITGLTAAYCPAQLVQQGPLSEMPARAQSLIEEALRKAFLDLNLIEPLREEAEASLAAVELIAAQFKSAWTDRPQRAELLRQLAPAAERLRAALAALPEGVVIP